MTLLDLPCEILLSIAEIAACTTHGVSFAASFQEGS